MATQVEIEDSCPHCGQLVGIRLTGIDPGQRNMFALPVIVDPAAAQLHAVHPGSDHPCPEERPQ